MGSVTRIKSLARLSPPASLAPDHDVSQFDCGRPEMNEWLRKHAFRSEGRTARTFVVCEGNRPAGYYCLAMGGMLERNQPRRARKHGDPKQIPVAIIARLAVDRSYQRRGLGSHLLGDALKRVLTVSGHIGVKAAVVHALDAGVASFYERHGFQLYPGESEQTYFLSLEAIAAAL